MNGEDPIMRIPLTIAVALALAVARPAAHAEPTRGPGKGMLASCQAVMADRKQMDARLDEKIAAMNAAQGGEKVEAMAAVLNELAAQLKSTHASMPGCCMEGGGPMTQP
jgi:hypothetical protein